MGECMVKSDATALFFKTYLSYNETTGDLLWLDRPRSMFSALGPARRWNTMYAGKKAGTIQTHKYGRQYIRITLDHKGFSNHRIAALCLGLIDTYGDARQVDHIDGNSINNKSQNLRACSSSINMRNHKIHSDNTSGITGVKFYKNKNKFKVTGRKNNRHLHLGYFDTIFEAACVRRAWELLKEYTRRHI